MPTQKQILASIDARLALLPRLAADVAKLLPAEPAPQPQPAPGPTPQPAPSPAPPVVTPPQPIPAGGMTREQIVAARLMLPYGGALYSNTYPKETRTYAYSPGAWGELGLTVKWPSTGERGDIGLVTDATAEWAMGGSPDNMLAQARGSATLPIHDALIDGRFVDVLVDPRASFDPRENPAPLFPWTHPTIEPDRNHAPALPNYHAYLLTGDLQFLRNLQAYASFLLMLSPNSYAQGRGILYPWETRGVAWPLRELFRVCTATEIAEQRAGGALPKPFLPARYWRQVLAANLDWFKTRYLAAWSFDDAATAASKRALVQSAGIVCAVTSDKDGDIPVFQQDYLLGVIGEAVYSGRHADWRAVYDVMVKQVIVRGAPAVRSEACQYYLDCNGAMDWPGLLTANGKLGTSGNIPPFMVTNSPHYIGLFRQNAALAVLNGVAGARAVYDWADNQARSVAKLICPRHAVTLSA